MTGRCANWIVWGAIALAVSACAAPAPAFDLGLNPSHEIHVAPEGSDVTGNGSADRPYRTLSKAADAVRPGAAIVLAPGVHSGGTYLRGLTGRSNAPIWIRGSSATHRPVLSGGTEGLHLTCPHWVVVENLEVRSASSNGINCDDGGDYANADAARFVVFRNLFVHDIGGSGNQDGLKLSGLRDYWVLDSEFARCGGNSSGSGIDHVGCHRGAIERCRFNQMSANAIQCKGGSTGIDIVRCVIENAGERGVNIGGSTGFEFFRPPLSPTGTNWEAREIRLVANVFRGARTPVAFVSSTDCLVANNTIVDPERWHLRILQETRSSGGYTFGSCGHSRFVNNLVWFARGAVASPDVNVGPGTDPASFTFAHNLWFARDLPGDSGPDLPVAETGRVVGLDPGLADPAAGDFAIRVSSPAFGRGMALPEVQRDHRDRIFLNPPSIGAFETSGDTDAEILSPGEGWALVASNPGASLEGFVLAEPDAQANQPAFFR